ncbi:MAG TPA: dienelactone hydrolase family protein, partial [Caulobacteraceae bacterium]|nr:dienelactone hydrolase family protein [Caulobacteraceae bacterium]
AVFFAGYAAAALSANAEPIHTDDVGLIVETVTYPSAGFALPAYLARPHASGRFPAVIVVNEIFGIHDYIKDTCRRLAKLGYVAIAPAFFARVGDPAPLTDMAAVMKIVAQASDTQVLGDVAATIAFLQSRPFVQASAMAITGFCWGGGITWLACEEFAQLRCGVAWYGRMVPTPGSAAASAHLWPIDRVDRLRAPVLGLYGAKDNLAAQVPAMREALAKAHKSDSEIIVYPDAGHGFHADYRESYNAADAKDGWARMLAHFRRHGVAARPFGAD